MADERIFTILHTNDFHNHLTNPQAKHIKSRKMEAGRDVLLVDAGDAISAGNIGVKIGGEPILELMNQTGYDMMTMGNREFHVSDRILRHKIGKAQFPILCSNIYYQSDSDETLPLQPYVIKTLPNGLRIAVIGVTVPMVTSKMAARILSAYLFYDPVKKIGELAAELRKDADVLIALTHIGLKEDQRLAAACQDLDLIIGGHSHVVLKEAQLIGTVPIVQAGWFGHYLGHVEMTVNQSGAHLLSSSLEDLRTFTESSNK
jgi:2',3'-cyclic-nucleotide 2'-phosphodiesterase (5'-nucleotidase family)